MEQLNKGIGIQTVLPEPKEEWASVSGEEKRWRIIIAKEILLTELH